MAVAVSFVGGVHYVTHSEVALCYAAAGDAAALGVWSGRRYAQRLRDAATANTDAVSHTASCANRRRHPVHRPAHLGQPRYVDTCQSARGLWHAVPCL